MTRSGFGRRGLRRPASVAVALLIVAGSFPRRCRADEPLSASEWVQAGIEDFKHNEYEAARVAFGQAYALDPSASTLLSLALAELQSDHPVEAIHHLRAYVKDPGAEPAKIEVVRSKWIPRAEKQTARLTIEAPVGAEVLVDGSDHGTAPLAEAVDIGVGLHDVTARLGSWSRSMHVILSAGEALHVQFQAEEAVPPPAPPATPVAVPAVAALSQTDTKPAAETGPSMPKLLTVIGLGTAALTATALGAIYATTSVNNASAATSLRSGYSDSSCNGANANDTRCTTLRDTNQSQSWNYWASVVAYSGAGVLAAAGVAVWFFWPNARKQDAWNLRPLVGDHVNGALLQTSF